MALYICLQATSAPFVLIESTNIQGPIICKGAYRPYCSAPIVASSWADICNNRHVRVHHVDKDKDDPLLRDVLAQVPEGSSRGRRRRLDIARPADEGALHPETSSEAVNSDINKPRTPSEPAQSQSNNLNSVLKKTDQTALEAVLPKLTSSFEYKDYGDSIVGKRLDNKSRGNLDANNTAFGTTSAITLTSGVLPNANGADSKASINNGSPDFEAPLPNIFPSNQVGYQPQSPATQPPVTQKTNQLVPVVPLSDSGYGTASHCSRKVAQLATLDDVARADVTSSHSNQPQISQEPENHPNLIDLETDDTTTVYSDTMSISDLRIDSYVSGLAEDLFRRLDSKVTNDQIIERLSTALPGLLKALALKFGFEASSQMHRDVMFFIHKHRM